MGTESAEDIREFGDSGGRSRILVWFSLPRPLILCNVGNPSNEIFTPQKVCEPAIKLG
jgi:hypothetical protein